MLSGEGVNTTAPLSDPIGAPRWSIRSESALDLDQIHDLHRDAFGRPEEAELVDAIRSGPDFIPELSLVAVADDGSVLGHVLMSRIGFRPAGAESPRIDVLSLAPIAVLRPHAGRGIGSALVRRALAVADERDEPFSVVLGAPSFFARHGFRPAAELGVDGPYADAGDAFAVRPRAGTGDPGPGTLTYPPMFEAV